MDDHTCQWTFLPSLDEPNERVCGAPVEGNSKYCAKHQAEMDVFLSKNPKEREGLRKNCTEQGTESKTRSNKKR
jgi:hypothetical protein